MVDSAIITVLDKMNDTIGDFEIPVKINIKELRPKIIGLLKAMDSEKYIGIDSINIEHNGVILKDEDTLYQNSIWDGSTIKLIY